MLTTIPVKKRKAVLGTESDKDGFTLGQGVREGLLEDMEI